MSNEDEYFARENAEKLRKLALERSAEMALEEANKLREAHWLRCAKCGMEMETIAFRGVEIERCFHCGGTYLDEGERDKLAGAESGLIKDIVGLFRKGG
jgi:hypothetical protein